MENQHACNHGKHRFHGKQQGGDGRFGILLGHHLKRIGDAAGHDAGIKNGKRRIQNITHLGCFKPGNHTQEIPPAYAETELRKFDELVSGGKNNQPQNRTPNPKAQINNQNIPMLI